MHPPTSVLFTGIGKWTLLVLLLLFGTGVFAENADTTRHNKHHFDIKKATLAFKLGKGTFVPLPVIGYNPETSLSLGVAAMYLFHFRNNDSSTNISNIKMSAVFTLKGQIILQPVWSLYIGKDRFRVSGDMAYRKYPDYYAGIGNSAFMHDSIRQLFKQKYDAEYLFLRPTVKVRVSKHLFVGVQYKNEALFHLKPLGTGLLDSSGIQGKDGYFSTGVGVIVEYDNRDNAFFPFKGTYVVASNTFYTPALGGNQAFQSVKLDIRQYFNPYGSHVVALQLYSENNIGKTPFRMMAELGGDMMMRGYYKGLYRDNNMLVFQAEYRFPIWWKFIGVAFGSTGDVYNEISDLSWKQLKVSGGLGLRFTLDAKERLNIRFDYAFGRFKQQGFYLGLAEAF